MPEVAAKNIQPVDVAVGILMKPNGNVLLGQRPAGKPYEGYWEFPGGKVEAGEAIVDALKREFVEELGIQIISAEPWCGVEHIYPHAHVRLHFYISRDWEGEPQSLEGQAFAWQGDVGVTPCCQRQFLCWSGLDCYKMMSVTCPSSTVNCSLVKISHTILIPPLG